MDMVPVVDLDRRLKRHHALYILSRGLKMYFFASVQHTCRSDKQGCADKVSSSDPRSSCEIAAERK